MKPEMNILAEEQAGFRKGKITVQQIFNCRNLMEKLQKIGINHNIIGMIKALYNDSTSSVLQNNKQGNNFKTSVRGTTRMPTVTSTV